MLLYWKAIQTTNTWIIIAREVFNLYFERLTVESVELVLLRVGYRVGSGIKFGCSGITLPDPALIDLRGVLQNETPVDSSNGVGTWTSHWWPCIARRN